MSDNAKTDTLNAGELQNKISLLRENLNRVIKGKADTIRLLITALGAGGNVLMEDVPGVGKTTLAKALAASIHGKFSAGSVHARPAAFGYPRQLDIQSAGS